VIFVPDKAGLKKFQEMEKMLKRFFSLFEDLCAHCFTESMGAISSGIRPHKYMCCCLVDNQVHDHWQSLSKAQEMMNGPNWARVIEQNSFTTGKRRMPNNGPCKALCERGCLLSCMRPPSCSTLVCSHMVRILVDLKLYQDPKHGEDCEVDELLGVQSPLDAMYGIKPGNTSSDQYVSALRALIEGMKATPEEQRRVAISQSKSQMSQSIRNGGSRR
jgi:hypothetical protein